MLSKRLLLFIIVPMALAFVAGAIMLQNELEKRFERRMQAEVEMVARALEPPVSNAIQRGHVDQIFSALESTQKIGRVYSAEIYDSDGELVASTRRTVKDAPEDALVDMESEDLQDGEYRQVDGENVYSYFVSLHGVGGRPLGLLEVTRLESDFTDFMHELRVRGAIWLVVLLLLVTAIVLLGYYGAAGKALASLRDSIDRIHRGEWEHRAAARGPTEIQRIADAFNRMVDTMTTAEAELRKTREAELALEKELRRSEKLAAIGRLAGGVAHELGTPLSTVRGRLQRCMRRESIDDAAREELDIAVDQTRRMERIVNELLEFGRTGSGRHSELNFDALIRSVVSSARSEAQNVDIEFLPAPEDIAIEANAARLEHALSNIIRNAIQAPGVETIRVSWSADDTQVQFVVDDDGEGIPDDIKSDVVEPFFTTKDDAEGTGLGLAIVDAAAEEHGGSITIDDSNELGGARVAMTISRERSTKS